jgi:hypothetical protein
LIPDDSGIDTYRYRKLRNFCQACFNTDESNFIAQFGLFPKHGRFHFMPCSFAMPHGNLIGMAIMSTTFTNKSNVGKQDTNDGIRSTIGPYGHKNGAGEFGAKDGMMWALIVCF